MVDSAVDDRNAYHDRKQKIRQALFIYFSIILDKLPSGHDFWSERWDRSKEDPDFSRQHLTDLEAFDRYYRREFMRLKLNTDLFCKEDVDSGVIKEPSDKDQYSPMAGDQMCALGVKTFKELINGRRNAQVDLETISNQLSEIYQPIIEGIERIFKEVKESSLDSAFDLSSSPMVKTVKTLVRIGREIQHELEKQLRKQSGNEKQTVCDSHLDRVITIALEFMGCVDEIHSDVAAITGGFKTMRENLSE